VDDLAVHVDLDQARRRDLLVQQSVRVDEELVLGTRNPQRNMVVHEVRPAMLGDQPVGGGQLDAGLPLLLAHALTNRRGLEIGDCHWSSSPGYGDEYG